MARRFAVLGGGAVLLSLAACGTQEIAPPSRVYAGTTSGPGLGALIVTFAPGAATYDDEQTWGATDPNPAQYGVMVDGAQLVRDEGGSPQPVAFGAGTEAGIGYLPAGRHHFTIAAPDGAATVFDGEAEIVADAQNQLYLFGPHGAVRSRFVVYPTQPAAGMMHVSAVSLVQGGATVEVVSCARDMQCASLSPPLALGDAFAADFPATALDTWPYYVPPDGTVLGLRQVPTATVPMPPVTQLSAGFTLMLPPDPSLLPPANMVIAPLYLGADGNLLALYE
jgi:hypothetical protein